MSPVNTIKPDHTVLWRPLAECVPPGGLHLNIWLPTKIPRPGPVPLHFMIHGGGWTVGASTDLPENQLEWFRDRGVICVSPEYRLLPRVNHLEQRQDVIDAYEWIQGNLNKTLKELGSDVTIDFSRCIVGGSSAGGTNSLWLAADIQRARKVDGSALPLPRAVLSAYPLVDFEDFGTKPTSALEESLKNNPEELAVVQSLLTGPACVSESFADLDDLPPLKRLQNIWFQAALVSDCLSSWMTGCPNGPPYPVETSLHDNIDTSFPPTWLYCALKDTLIPYQHTVMVHDKLESLGVENVLVKSEAPHGFVDSFRSSQAEEKEQWYRESILPSMEWAMKKLA